MTPGKEWADMATRRGKVWLDLRDVIGMTLMMAVLKVMTRDARRILVRSAEDVSL